MHKCVYVHGSALWGSTSNVRLCCVSRVAVAGANSHLSELADCYFQLIAKRQQT